MLQRMLKASVLFTRGEPVDHWWRWCSTSVPTDLRGCCSDPRQQRAHYPPLTQHLKSAHLSPSQQSLAPKRNDCIPHSCPCEDQRMIMTSSLSQQHAGSLMRISWESPKSHHQISGSNAKLPLLSPLPMSVWWTLVSDGSLSWPYSAGSRAMLSHRSLPRGPHRKSWLPGRRGERNSQLNGEAI